MPKKTVKKAVVKTVKKEETPVTTGTSFFDYLRFGESYTSLVLGIIVVIISTALLLSFVHNKNTLTTNTVVPAEPTKPIAMANQGGFQISTVPSLSPIAATPVVSPSVEPTKIVVPTKEAAKPTLVPTKETVKPSLVPTKVAEPTKTPAADLKNTKTPAKEGEYIVKSGDTLWSIAEKEYKSGYNWVDIAKANNLSNPGAINAGNKLVLPKVIAKAQTVQAAPTVMTKDEQNNKTVMQPQPQAVASNKITGETYKIVRGDTMWSIAERAYGNGYKWTDIAKANGYTNPGLIHADNVIKIPRG